MAAPDQQPEPDRTEAAIVALVALYTGAQAMLLVGFARVIRQALAQPGDVDYDTLRRRLSEVADQQGLRVHRSAPAAVARVFDAIRHDADKRARTVFEQTSPKKAAPDVPAYLSHAETSAQAIRDDLAMRLSVVDRNILRTSDDLYADIVASAAEALVKNEVTPQEAVGEAFSAFVERGMTGYTTRDGRRLPIESYAEMAVRTASLRAYNTSYENRLRSMGVDYFIVPNDPSPCPLCFPWQHAVLAPTGKDDVADASIEEARADGLFHPNCKHVLMPYFPGHTLRPERQEWTAEHDARYKATQRLRGLERRVRRQKQARDHSVTPDSRRTAGNRVRLTEAAIRRHVAEHGLVRRRKRETARH